jgi:N utilization substance protein A
VDDTQLSLAIGKKGQNVRLAAKLLGWKIDIKSEEEKRQEVEQQMQALAGAPTTPIEQVTELGEGIIQKLVTAGITTVEGLADMTPEQLEEIPGIGEKTLEKISVAVRHYFGQFEEAEAAAAAEGAEPAAEAASDGEAGEAVAVEAGEAAAVAEETESAAGEAEPVAATEAEVSAEETEPKEAAAEEKTEQDEKQKQAEEDGA